MLRQSWKSLSIYRLRKISINHNLIAGVRKGFGRGRTREAESEKWTASVAPTNLFLNMFFQQYFWKKKSWQIKIFDKSWPKLNIRVDKIFFSEDFRKKKRKRKTASLFFRRGRGRGRRTFLRREEEAEAVFQKKSKVFESLLESYHNSNWLSLQPKNLSAST